ncbi:hypothetical protein GGQ94_003155 [Petrimonas sulfuriphila]
MSRMRESCAADSSTSSAVLSLDWSSQTIISRIRSLIVVRSPSSRPIFISSSRAGISSDKVGNGTTSRAGNRS